ncbi:beta-aspartyl-peptidase [Thalassospira profundimaris]|uniref:Isoaspartyl dipeptidase n=1 Tax=Thalassospira profundimaris TaxID=502049 RepID=A0A367X6G5_9PROT|nr:beta-aspartyl-peptidase [Thalassospira profundimaris]RCK49254.1 isoaspartyl dipeptidase [Thalassospira profundimaris]
MMFLLLKNANIFAPAPMGINDILICNDKIIAIAPDLVVSVPGEIKTIDLGGKLTVPGFIDGHAHLIGGGGEGGFATRTPEVAIGNLIEAGITSICGLLGTDAATRHIASLYAKTKALQTEGISAWFFTGGYRVPSPTLTGNIGDDVTFLDACIGLKTAISDHRSSQSTIEELARIASQSRIGGMTSGKAGSVVVHLGDGDGHFDPLIGVIENTEIPIAQFIPTHVNRKRALLDAARDWAKRGGNIDFTTGIDAEPDPAGSVKTSTGIAECLADGVPLDRISMTSDGNGSLPDFDAQGNMIGLTVAGFDTIPREFADLVEREKLDITTALAPITLNPARMLGLDGFKGQLKTGFDADILVLDDALAPETVIARGKPAMISKERLIKGTFEA